MSRDWRRIEDKTNKCARPLLWSVMRSDVHFSTILCECVRCRPYGCHDTRMLNNTSIKKSHGQKMGYFLSLIFLNSLSIFNTIKCKYCIVWNMVSKRYWYLNTLDNLSIYMSWLSAERQEGCSRVSSLVAPQRPDRLLVQARIKEIPNK